MSVARKIIKNSKLVPGAGPTELTNDCQICRDFS